MTLFFIKPAKAILLEQRKAGGALIKRDPRFARVRENSSEFVNDVQARKLLRDAVSGLLMKASDNRLTPRLTQLMSRIQKLDTLSKRGNRNIGIAMMQPEAKAMLEGFEFNIKGQVKDLIHKPYYADVQTGTIIITDLIPKTDVAYPASATHLRLSGALANVDFAERTFAIELTNTVTLPVDNTATTVNLIPAVIPSGTGTQIILLKIEFLQAISGAMYPLNNDGFCGMRIVGAG